MIINTGQRTDIPAYFSKWFYQRIKEGYVYVRNPYYPSQVYHYELNPEVVDCLCFCTKNPQPMLDDLSLIKEYRQIWYVTITPYDKRIEPYVPSMKEVIESVKQLSSIVGKDHVIVRYDPIIINDIYTIDKHKESFEYLLTSLDGYINRCVFSFIDLYEKTKRNFPGIKEVSLKDKHTIGQLFSSIALKHHVQLYSCVEGDFLSQYGINTDGCMSKTLMEEILKEELLIKPQSLREGCNCLLGNDIGAYHSCLHGCLYCYANDNRELVEKNYKRHDPMSPLLIGHIHTDDIIKKRKQTTSINPQLSLDL